MKILSLINENEDIVNKSYVDNSVSGASLIYYVTYEVTTYAEIVSAYNAGKIPVLFKDNELYVMSKITSSTIYFSAMIERRHAAVAYVNAAADDWHDRDDYLGIEMETNSLYNVTSNKLATMNDIKDFFPLNSIYTTTSSSVDPNSFMPGVWSNIGNNTIGTTTVYYWERDDQGVPEYVTNPELELGDISRTGENQSDTGYSRTKDYLYVYGKSRVTITNNKSVNMRVLFFDENKALLTTGWNSGYNYYNISGNTGTGSVNIPAGAYFMRFRIASDESDLTVSITYE